MELRYIIEMEDKYSPPDNALSLKKVLGEYPLYIETYTDITSGQTINRREELNKKIMDRYYFCEIGFETKERFLFALQRKLNEIMKYYNQMYKSVDFEFNPLWNVDMTETFEHEVTNVGKTTSNGNTTLSSEDTIVNSDTPPNEISRDDIIQDKYATSTQHNKNGETNTSNGEVNQNGSQTEKFTRHESGSSKGYTFAQNIEQWRNIMINVDVLIVDELKNLFMNIW
jgi:hypothetical protein